jgi:hypothetical protein
MAAAFGRLGRYSTRALIALLPRIVSAKHQRGDGEQGMSG